MSYKPTEKDAMGAYVAAAAHQYNVPIEVISEVKHLCAVAQWPHNGNMRWHIINSNDLKGNGKSVGDVLQLQDILYERPLIRDIAICQYGFQERFWEVTFWEEYIEFGNSLIVSAVEGSYTVVGEQKWDRRDDFGERWDLEGVRTRDYTLAEIAFHQAGHYVAAVLLLQAPPDISLMPGCEPIACGGGKSEYQLEVQRISEQPIAEPQSWQKILDDLAWQTAIQAADSHIFLCRAGYVAAQLYLDQLYGQDARHTVEADKDWGVAEETWGELRIDLYSDDEGDEFLWDCFGHEAEIESFTEHLFTYPNIWAAIKYTAHVLLNSRTLDAAATKALHQEVLQMLKEKAAGPYLVHLQEKDNWPSSFADNA